MGAKIDFANGNGPSPEPIPAQSSKRQLSDDGLVNQPFNEWRPHRMKTGLTNHPIGRRGVMIGLPVFAYNGAASRLENAGGVPVDNHSRPVVLGKVSRLQKKSRRK